MTGTATPIANGPFEGFFDTRATLFALDPALTIHEAEVTHVVVSTLEADEHGPAETYVFAANEYGDLDVSYYINHQAVMGLDGVIDVPRALRVLGYDHDE